MTGEIEIIKPLKVCKIHGALHDKKDVKYGKRYIKEKDKYNYWVACRPCALFYDKHLRDRSKDRFKQKEQREMKKQTKLQSVHVKKILTRTRRKNNAADNPELLASADKLRVKVAKLFNKL